MNKIYFPGLNGIRFVAAFGVVVHHIEQIKSLHGMPNLWMEPNVQRLGSLCVSLFFVLSGFLITYLLVEEKDSCGNIDIKKFYIRRALRTWPLYFVITILGFFVLPNLPAYDVPTFPLTHGDLFWKKLGLYLVFSPHVEAAWFPSVSYAGVLWSVGVEEWFYSFWPWLVKYARRILVLVLVVIIVMLMWARVAPFVGRIAYMVYVLRFDCMAVGGLFALLLRSSAHRQLPRMTVNFLFRRDVQLVVYALLAFALVNAWTFGRLEQPIYSILFATAILNIGSNPNSFFHLEHPLFRWLGEISYGLYCYNWIAVVSAILLVKVLIADISGIYANLAVYLLGLALTVLFSALSYYAVERPFLNLKRKLFTRVVTLTTPAA